MLLLLPTERACNKSLHSIYKIDVYTEHLNRKSIETTYGNVYFLYFFSRIEGGTTVPGPPAS